MAVGQHAAELLLDRLNLWKNPANSPNRRLPADAAQIVTAGCSLDAMKPGGTVLFPDRIPRSAGSAADPIPVVIRIVQAWNRIQVYRKGGSKKHPRISGVSSR